MNNQMMETTPHPFNECTLRTGATYSLHVENSSVPIQAVPCAEYAALMLRSRELEEVEKLFNQVCEDKNEAKRRGDELAAVLRETEDKLDNCKTWSKEWENACRVLGIKAQYSFQAVAEAQKMMEGKQ